MPSLTKKYSKVMSQVLLLYKSIGAVVIYVDNNVYGFRNLMIFLSSNEVQLNLSKLYYVGRYV